MYPPTRKEKKGRASRRYAKVNVPPALNPSSREVLFFFTGRVERFYWSREERRKGRKGQKRGERKEGKVWRQRDRRREGQQRGGKKGGKGKRTGEKNRGKENGKREILGRSRAVIRGGNVDRSFFFW